MKTRRLRTMLVGVWEPIIFGFGSFLVMGFLLIFRLGSIVPGYSQPEVVSHAASSALLPIIKDPLNAYYKIITFGLDNLGKISPFYLRSVSVVFSVLLVLLFYYVVSRWHDRNTAVMGTIIFICSAWFLHYARIATPDITAALLLAALAYGHWIRRTKKSMLVGVVGILLLTTLFYTPGLIWFVVLGGIWQSKQIGYHLKETKLSVPLLVVIAAALLTPLAVAIVRNPLLIKQAIGLPAQLPDLYNLTKQILNVPFQLFFRGPNDPVFWLGRLPLLDIFTLSMFLLGIYSYYHRLQLDRAKLLVGVFFLGTILVGLNGSVKIIILAPFVYLLVAAGVAYLLNQWLSVFPRNPLAKGVGIGLVTFAIVIACFYNLRQYFRAWPGAPATKQAFQLKI